MKYYYIIYSLNCPINPEIVRYIGITKCTLEKRFRDHKNDKAKNHKCNWINSLKKQGLLPLIDTIDEGWLTDEEAFQKEICYIKLFKSFGARLTNLTNGGDGFNGYKFTEEDRFKMSESHKGKKGFWKGKKRSEETNNKIRETLTGRKTGPLSEEHKEKISKANTGKKQSEEVIRRIADKKRGKKWTEEQKIRYRELMRSRPKRKGPPSWNKGKKGVYSKETLLKKSLAIKGRKLSEEHKKKLSLAKMGKKRGKQSPQQISRRIETQRKNREIINQEKLSMIF